MKRLIYCMSKTKKEVGSDLEENTGELIQDLIKLAFYPDNINKSKWRKEIASFLNKTSRLKGKHKLPSAQFILDNTWNIHKNRFSYYINIVTDDFGEPQNIQMNEKTIKENVQAYFIWIALQLSEYQYVSYQSIYHQLEHLGFWVCDTADAYVY